MARIAQIGIVIGALGAMLMLMALYPGVTGLPPTPGMGIVQISVFLMGASWFVAGALFYVKFAFYADVKSNLSQQIGTRLAFTGLVLAVLAGFSDALGFGSHGTATGDTEYFGPLQTAGMLGSYFISCIGVLVYAIFGPTDTGAAVAGEDDPPPAEDRDDLEEQDSA